MRNLNPPRLHSGMHLIVEELSGNLIAAKINIGAFKNDTAMIPRITLNLSVGEDVRFQNSQFPNAGKRAFTLTMDKVQRPNHVGCADLSKTTIAAWSAIRS